jgi:hypothetical protein
VKNSIAFSIIELINNVEKIRGTKERNREMGKPSRESESIR